MRRKFLLLTLPILLLTSCRSDKTSQEGFSSYQSSSETFGLINYQYEELGDKLIYWEDVPRIELSHYYVYFFSRTCGHCENIRNLVIPNLLKRKIFFACEASNSTVLCNHQNYGSFSQIDFCIIGYPTIIEVKNWAVIRYANGENEVLSFLNTK